jgi:hypothetical protein
MSLHFTCGAWKRRRDVVQIGGCVDRRGLDVLYFLAFFMFYRGTFGNNKPV